MRRMAVVIALVATFLLGAEDEATRTDLKVLSGTWVAVGGEAEGVKIPKEDLPVQWTFKAGGEAVFFHRERNDEARYTYTIDPSKKPKAITITYVGPAKALKGKKQFGIYKIEKDRLILCLTGIETTEKERPKEFASKAKGVLLLRLARDKDK